jgi:hypothetical protein
MSSSIMKGPMIPMPMSEAFCPKYRHNPTSPRRMTPEIIRVVPLDIRKTPYE